MNTLASDKYFELTDEKYLYNIMPIYNIASVVKNGILCHERVANLEHKSIAMEEIQARRDVVMIPNGLKLHQYANLYFTYNNPMLYKRKDEAENFCVLALSVQVLDLNGCIVTDRNASTSLVKFYSPFEGLEKLDYKRIFAQYWIHEDPYETRDHRAIKCAEVLIPSVVPSSYIVGAYVVNQEAKERMEEQGFPKKIVVKPKVFYH